MTDRSTVQPRYPTSLRVASGVALIIDGVGLANFGLWHWAAAGLSQKQMLMVAFLPSVIIALMVL